ncbi:hypothetical protein [Streptomyces sp. MBT84]|uniref:hypothetical protein n=1 Tax=Streptomyces sp. MBT84 TaxID=1488414 RepID=UPI001C6F0211|nr:hypothetical protein [Streptomyces sp. MBT84]
MVSGTRAPAGRGPYGRSQADGFLGLGPAGTGKGDQRQDPDEPDAEAACGSGQSGDGALAVAIITTVASVSTVKVADRPKTTMGAAGNHGCHRIASGFFGINSARALQ